ncbi:phycobiliprotein lyase [Waterburya agarophytonicola K14]|uniref:Chromophore lyase CpcS/CpeS n=1 Tax=Waterburya agarophytonicola KI4 TaxID=2874699 RepID=A0A964BRL4_9CYAN|nr:phycobiliprotein lyase [Waterburya agarophytonicola]MCC0178339.1 phycobiliprotein lyase [Waterburya agarophytonicola KI4]
MNIDEFVESSLGTWRSQRSAHHMAFHHFEEVTSEIEISLLEHGDERVIKLCKTNKVDPHLATSPFFMKWEGESDWDEDEVLAGSTVLVPVPDLDNPSKGRLLREQGYAETVPAIGYYHLIEDGSFVLTTQYERASAEEKIWFATPNLRLRVSLIKTGDGKGVTTASFSSEIRALNLD